MTNTIRTLFTAPISTALQGQLLAKSTIDGETELSRLQEQVSSGHQYSIISQDARKGVQALALQTQLQQIDVYQQSIQTNQGFLTTSEQALGNVSDLLNQATGLAQSGIGSTTSASQKQAIAAQISSILQGVTNAANSKYNGRYLFGGANTQTQPFTQTSTGVRYSGDGSQLSTFADFNVQTPNNVDGLTAFAAESPPIYTDLNPAISLNTRISQLNAGTGSPLGTISVSITNGANTYQHNVNLAGSETLQDVKARIENAFVSDPVSVTVAVDPTTNFGLSVTPSAGTVTIADQAGSTVAAKLGIVATNSALVHGTDINPTLSPKTLLSALNNGTGIGPTSGFGLQIVEGGKATVVDLSTAVTVQDVIDRIHTAVPDADARISADGTGLQISSRVSGTDFSIGENGGQNATLLGVRTLTGSTPLSGLNHGAGVPVTATPLVINRRDGTTTSIDLTGSVSIQDVITKINAAAPGVLTATLNTVGNGISLTDSSGSGTLIVPANEVSTALGISGSDTNGATGVLAGKDNNPQQPSGVFSILQTIVTALNTGDDRTVSLYLPKLTNEVTRIAQVRGNIGSSQNLLTQVNSHFEDSKITLKSQLSDVYDTDQTTVITELLQRQQALQASLQVASKTLNLSIVNYI